MQFDLLEHILTLLGNKGLELLANRFQMVRFLFIEFVQQLHFLVPFLLDEVPESIAFA